MDVKNTTLAAVVVAYATALLPAARAEGFASSPASHLQGLLARLTSEWTGRAAARAPATAVEPSLVSGKILTPNINVGVAPGVPEFEVTVKAGTVGLSSFIAVMTSPNGQQSISTGLVTPPPYPAEPARETIKFQVTSPFRNGGFGLYTQPGVWTLSGMVLFTNDRSVVNYNGSQLASVFSSTTVNVTNTGVFDVTAPTVQNGSILTPTVSLGSAPFFAARLHVEDNLSGVASVGLNVSGPTGSNFNAFAYVQPTAPVLSAGVVTSVQLQPNSPLGTYTINSIEVCDVAQNCFDDTNPADISAKFGTTTFDVTN